MEIATSDDKPAAPMEIATSDDKPAAPYEDCSWVTSLFLAFCSPLLRAGNSRDLTAADVWPLSKSFSATGTSVTSLSQRWATHVASRAEGEEPSLVRVVMQEWAGVVARQSIGSVLYFGLLVLGTAFFLPNVLLFLQDQTWVTWLGWVYICSWFASNVLCSFVQTHVLYRNSLLAVHVQNALMSMLVRKAP